FSSHRLLWEMIAHELAADPFALGDDPREFLAKRIKRAGVNSADVSEAVFLEKLIWPAYQRAVAQMIAETGLPLRLAGDGWEQAPGLEKFAAAAPRSHEQFSALVVSSTVLLDGWAGWLGHPVRHQGRPVLGAARTRPAFIQQARNLCRSAIE